jgi:hypothetical protein
MLTVLKKLFMLNVVRLSVAAPFLRLSLSPSLSFSLTQSLTSFVCHYYIFIYNLT